MNPHSHFHCPFWQGLSLLFQAIQEPLLPHLTIFQWQGGAGTSRTSIIFKRVRRDVYCSLWCLASFLTCVRIVVILSILRLHHTDPECFPTFRSRSSDRRERRACLSGWEWTMPEGSRAWCQPVKWGLVRQSSWCAHMRPNLSKLLCAFPSTYTANPHPPKVCSDVLHLPCPCLFQDKACPRPSLFHDQGWNKIPILQTVSQTCTPCTLQNVWFSSENWKSI